MSLLNSQSRGPINRADRLTHGPPYICLTADSRSSKHYKLCRFEIKSTQPGSQIYVPIGRYSLCVNKFVKRRETSAERDCSACREGSLDLVRVKTWRSIQEIFYKSKTSPRFPNFEASNAWQMGHNSRKCFFLRKNCSWTLLPGSTWLQMPITPLRYISCLRSSRTHFDSLKRVDDLRVYQGFMMPLSHQAGIQGT